MRQYMQCFVVHENCYTKGDFWRRLFVWVWFMGMFLNWKMVFLFWFDYFFFSFSFDGCFCNMFFYILQIAVFNAVIFFYQCSIKEFECYFNKFFQIGLNVNYLCMKWRKYVVGIVVYIHTFIEWFILGNYYSHIIWTLYTHSSM